MKSQFRARRKQVVSLRIVLICISTILIALIMGIYQLDRVIVPFQSENPLWHEATVGEKVIDNWTYGGHDEEGYLEFTQKGEPPALFPPNSHLIALDGKFVVVEKQDTTELTYAEPGRAVSMKWLLSGMGIFTLLGSFMFYLRTKRLGNVRRMNKIRKVMKIPVLRLKPSKGFRAFRK